jgi:hypothetical protein
MNVYLFDINLSISLGPLDLSLVSLSLTPYTLLSTGDMGRNRGNVHLFLSRLSLFMARRSATLQLRLGPEAFPVKKTHLLENLGLFQDRPSLLATDSYEVRTEVSSDIFREFLKVIKGAPITVSDATCDSFWRLGQEFRFELLSAACTAFRATQESKHRSVTKAEVSGPGSDSVEIPAVSRPCVTITIEGDRRTYTTLDSVGAAMLFADDLFEAPENGIAI